MVEREQARPLAPSIERPSSDEDDTTLRPRHTDPVITMNGVKITKLELVNTITPKPGANMSLIADVSVKNPNVASFR
ncbi:hypothetical protein E2542_SST30196 [Spatholobus suberectus]|nr:hypothetical protein E2542_SST30196 [Spatholobus suberectus]